VDWETAASAAVVSAVVSAASAASASASAVVSAAVVTASSTDSAVDSAATIDEMVAVVLGKVGEEISAVAASADSKVSAEPDTAAGSAEDSAAGSAAEVAAAVPAADPAAATVEHRQATARDLFHHRTHRYRTARPRNIARRSPTPRRVRSPETKSRTPPPRVFLLFSAPARPLARVPFVHTHASPRISLDAPNARLPASHASRASPRALVRYLCLAGAETQLNNHRDNHPAPCHHRVVAARDLAIAERRA